jgi:hypothetical protein
VELLKHFLVLLKRGVGLLWDRLEMLKDGMCLLKGIMWVFIKISLIFLYYTFVLTQKYQNVKAGF